MHLRAWLPEWTEALLGFVYPPVCQLCKAARATVAGGYVCDRCRERVSFVKPPFCDRCGRPYEGSLTTPFECANCRDQELHYSAARSAVVARDPVLEVIHRYKYNRALWFEPFLANLLIQSSGPALSGGGWDCIVPVPLHPVKEREREFNQSRRLGGRLSRATGIPLKANWVQRVKATRTQTLLTRPERAANMNGAFAMRKGLKLNGARVVLIDDVFTTGATANACARALRGAGAGDVCVWTVARGI
jgi:ComF family protein